MHWCLSLQLGFLTFLKKNLRKSFIKNHFNFGINTLFFSKSKIFLYNNLMTNDFMNSL